MIKNDQKNQKTSKNITKHHKTPKWSFLIESGLRVIFFDVFWCFLIVFDRFWSILIISKPSFFSSSTKKNDHFWSLLIKIDQKRSKSITKRSQNDHKTIKNDQKLSQNDNKTIKNHHKTIKMDHKTIKIDQNRSQNDQNRSKWSFLIDSDRFWSILMDFHRFWSKSRVTTKKTIHPQFRITIHHDECFTIHPNYRVANDHSAAVFTETWFICWQARRRAGRGAVGLVSRNFDLKSQKSWNFDRKIAKKKITKNHKISNGTRPVKCTFRFSFSHFRRSPRRPYARARARAG